MAHEDKPHARRTMRLYGQVERISYDETAGFFERRAERYRDDAPYTATMYQDKNPDLAAQRNRRELEKLLPLIRVGDDSNVLDVACGMGRWAEAMPAGSRYVGIDRSQGLVDIARRRNARKRADFVVGSATELDALLAGAEPFDRVLMVGILMYLNDGDVLKLFDQVERHCSERALVCVREPVGLFERMTLKDYFSEELGDSYNAIYRTRSELEEMLAATLLSKGFEVSCEGRLFDSDSLNNRAETTQYFYILER